MNLQEQVAKLESLLDRIRRRAAEPRSGGRVAGAVEPAVTSAPAELEELDMMDAEIVEIEAPAAESPVDEPVPESAPRAAQSLADHADLEPPVKTPPPESGRQVMGPAASNPPVSFQTEEVDLSGGSDVDSLLEADLSNGPISKAPSALPTMEQLGETVELEGADAPRTELELLMPEPASEAPPDELELALPKQEFAGGYNAALAPPAGTAGDLERHRREEIQSAAASQQSHPEPSSIALSAAPSTQIAKADPVVERPVVVERRGADTLHAAEVIAAKPPKLPETFVELLDASLRL